VELVTSVDGTRIAYQRSGDGPALILVNGALGERSDAEPMAATLARRFTAIAYDRRGRGDSGDTAPYAPVREIEDLDAIIRAAGGEAFVYGHSSGAALALEAAVSGLAISGLALYEPPYLVNDSRPPVPADYVPTLRAFIADGRRAEAIEYFWRVALLMPDAVIAQLRNAPMWPGLLALAHTLSYDGEVMGDHMRGRPLPAEWAAQVTIPTLVIDGADSPPQLRDAVAAVAALLPHATRRTLGGQGHGAPPEVVAPVLEAFFGAHTPPAAAGRRSNRGVAR
jgi:pimeloyl-ACP methyl ester carboxylesterase